VTDGIESFAVVDNSTRVREVINLTGLSWEHRDLIGMIELGALFADILA
jgi:hypothetical protein